MMPVAPDRAGATLITTLIRIVITLGATLWLAPIPLLAQSAISGLGYGSVAAARAALVKKPAVQTIEQAGWTIITDQHDNDFTTWTFAPRAHAAYPSVVRRDIVFKNGNPTLITRLFCEAQPSTCDALYRSLQARIARCTGNCTTLLP